MLARFVATSSKSVRAQWQGVVPAKVARFTAFTRVGARKGCKAQTSSRVSGFAGFGMS